MKKTTFLFFLMLPALIFSQVSLFQTTTNNIIDNTSASCRDPETRYTRENDISRLYDLPSLGYSSFTVNRVSFGIQTIDLGTADSYTLTVQVLSSTSGTVPTDIEVIVNQEVTVTGDNAMQIIDVDLTTPAVVNTPGMLININYPHGGATETTFFLGANSDGQTAPAYIFAAGCAITELRSLADISPNSHIIIYPTGTAVLGAESFKLEKETSVSPNPATNQLTISVPNGEEFKNVTLFSVLGKEVLRSSNATFNVSSLQSGVYFANIEIGNTTIVKKIIKN